MTDKNTLGDESRVIEATVRLVKMAHIAIPVSAATKIFNKKDKSAVAAAAPSRFKDKANGTQSGGAPYELPNGQCCSKGTCHFNHDKVNRGGPAIVIHAGQDRCLKKYSKTSSKSSASRTHERTFEIPNTPSVAFIPLIPLTFNLPRLDRRCLSC
eukprot:3907346-Pleurochrysis_carterae.AAC.1